jgi:Leucine-rich repeat (LRR) protein
MGYYLDFVFDRDEKLDFELVLDRFKRAGASEIDPDHIDNNANGTILIHEKIASIIEVVKNKPIGLRANWAQIGLSWDEDANSMANALQNILDLARDVGCRVYDGQTEVYITPETLDKIVSFFVKTSRNAIAIFDASANNWLTNLIERKGALSIEELDRRFENIGHLPCEIGQLRNLKILRLGGNQLSSLPHDINQLKQLIYLCLMRNQLTSIPKEIFEFRNLVELGLAQNKLTVLDSAISQLINLERLDLGGNKLTLLSPEICRLTHLHELDLRANLLKTLPDDFGELQSLKSLGLSRNRLNVVPPQIYRLRDLTNLHLDGNNLSTLPPEIGNLIHLEELSLHLNPLTSLPREICNLVSLQKITLPKFGMFSDIPTEIDLSNPQEIFRYIFNESIRN